MFENPQLILTVLGLVVAMSGVVAGYYYFRRTRKYKELSYEISPTLLLVRVGPTVREHVEITYKDEGLEIKDLKAVAVTIHSTGTEAVAFPPSDVPQGVDTQVPVTLDFGRRARIVGEPSVETSPRGRKVALGRVPTIPGRIVMDRFLLNPGEFVTISTFLRIF